jgi:transglutaminase-like putative cysteine protease
MRIGVRHETHYHYDAPPTGVIQTLRLTPRNHEGQFVLDWRIEVSADCRLDEQEDAFGNIIHAFTADAPLTDLTVTAAGVVETRIPTGSCATRSSAFRRAFFCARPR